MSYTTVKPHCILFAVQKLYYPICCYFQVFFRCYRREVLMIRMWVALVFLRMLYSLNVYSTCMSAPFGEYLNDIAVAFANSE